MEPQLTATNKTIKYFYHLIKWEGGSSTILRLSLEFTKKEFTKDMKQVVGNTEIGLLKFLSEHPTYFTVNGDQISTTNTPPHEEIPDDRHVQTAVSYVCKKLTNYVDTSIPVAILFRQLIYVTKPTRNIIGINIEQFHNFLVSHPYCFLISSDDNSVSLKNCTTNVQPNYKWQIMSCLTNTLNHLKFTNKYLLDNTFIVDTTEECRILIDQIFTEALNKCKTNNNQSWPFTCDRVAVGLDCEYFKQNDKKHILLIKIAVPAERLFVFDVMTCPAMMETGLKRLLLSYEVIKVVYDSRLCFPELHKQFNVIPQNVYDLLAGYSVQIYQENTNAIPKICNLGLKRLCRNNNCPNNPFTARSEKFSYEAKMWKKRPFNRELTLLVTARVFNLLPVYFSSVKQILPENYNLLLEFCKIQAFVEANLPFKGNLNKKVENQTDIISKKPNNKESAGHNAGVSNRLLAGNLKETTNSLTDIEDKVKVEVAVKVKCVKGNRKRAKANQTHSTNNAEKRQKLDHSVIKSNAEKYTDQQTTNFNTQKKIKLDLAKSVRRRKGPHRKIQIDPFSGNSCACSLCSKKR